MRISKLGFKRLWRLVHYMHSLPVSANEHFNMSSFFSHKGSNHEHVVPKNPTIKDLQTCGTTACVLGWAMTVRAFRRAGLHAKRWEDTGKYSVEGSMEVFSIPEHSRLWDNLFGQFNADRTPKTWAGRVGKLLDTWEREEREFW